MGSREAGERPDARILIVVPALGAGGTEQAVSALASGWAERGHRVTLATLEAADAPVYHRLHSQVRLKRLGVPVRLDARARGVWNAARRIYRIRRLVRDTRPDLIISFLTRMNVLTLLATLGLDVPGGGIGAQQSETPDVRACVGVAPTKDIPPGLRARDNDEGCHGDSSTCP